MKIDETILKALQEATAYRGGQVDLAHKAGLNKSLINTYLAGKIKDMELETWQKLAPHLREFLPDNYINIGGDNNGMAQNVSGGSVRNSTGDLQYKTALIAKILNSNDLDAETKIKVLKIVNE